MGEEESLNGSTPSSTSKTTPDRPSNWPHIHPQDQTGTQAALKAQIHLRGHYMDRGHWAEKRIAIWVGEPQDTIITCSTWICPDLLDYYYIGVADNLRGRVVRAFFWLMRGWGT